MKTSEVIANKLLALGREKEALEKFLVKTGKEFEFEGVDYDIYVQALIATQLSVQTHILDIMLTLQLGDMIEDIIKGAETSDHD